MNSTTAQEVIHDVQELLQVASNYDQESWESTLHTVAALDTDYKRMSRYQDNGYIKPVTHKIGQRLESVNDKLTRTTQQRMVDCEIQYVPIKSTLAVILKNDKIRTLLEAASAPIPQDILETFEDGERYKRIPIYSASKPGIKVQLKLYQDDIETANPLGANRGIYKLTMYYVSLLNLPPQYHSLLAHHHLVCVAMASDIKHFGHSAVTKIIAKEIRELEMGVLIDNRLVYGTLVALSGDNLGLNGILGMVESFSATHYCRFCMMTKEECQYTFSSVKANSLARNAIDHRSHVAESNPRETGVVCGSPLDELQYFKVIESFTPDIMHDILEGVLKLELPLIMESFIKQGYITIDYVNLHLDAFDYGYTDACNKPRCITRSNGVVHITQSASRMWCLARVLPIIIGDFVPQDSDEMETFRLLREIMAYAFSPVHSISSTAYLDCLVEEHHILFMKLWPKNKLTPKQHNLLHYGEAIRRNGPLTQFSAMRSESKHQLAKTTASLSCNFQNVPLTVARKYQLNSFSLWVQDQIHPQNEVQGLKRKELGSVYVNGSKIMSGCVVIKDDGDICQVEHLYLDKHGNPEMHVVRQKAEWSSKLMAYKIEPKRQDANAILPPLLKNYHNALSVWKSVAGERCIVTRYKVEVREY